jgi:cell wall-associated NlpC family hydrolase
MRIRTLLLGAAIIAATVVGPASPAGAGAPSWARASVRYLKSHDYVGRSFAPRRAVPRRTFKRIMSRAFGGGYSKTRGKVRAAEVSKALVKALGKASVAAHLSSVRARGGWDPDISRGEGHQIVAKEMGLRHDSTVETEDAGGNERIMGAELAWAVHRAKTGANTWGADALTDFDLGRLNRRQKKVVHFAFNQVDEPYVWAGEWESRTPAGYPYGAQAQGGFDCSGFTWYVLRSASGGWHPKKRPYRGWSLPDRSSSYMGRNARPKLGYRELRPGDVMLFASGGRRAAASSIYHAGVFLGGGWMIDSSGSQGGVSLSEVGRGSWYRDDFAWGRRVIR